MYGWATKLSGHGRWYFRVYELTRRIVRLGQPLWPVFLRRFKWLLLGLVFGFYTRGARTR